MPATPWKSSAACTISISPSIDFEHGPHGMTLLSAISALREDMPVIVITRDDQKHVEALAYTNGATVCFSKHAVATQLANAIRELSKARSEQVFA